MQTVRLLSAFEWQQYFKAHNILSVPASENDQFPNEYNHMHER